MPDSDSPARWLVILDELDGFTEYTGGIGRTYAALLPALKNLGVDVEVLLITDYATSTTQFDSNLRVTIRRVPNIPFMSGLLRALIARRFASSRRFQLVIATEWRGLAALVRRRTPVVTNLSTGLALVEEIKGAGSTLGARRWLSSWLQRGLENIQLRRSSAWIGVSDAILTWYSARIPNPPPSAVVRNCVDFSWLAAPKTEQRSATPTACTTRVVTFFGRLERRKGLAEAVEAFNSLAHKFPDISFQFIGAEGDVSRGEESFSQVARRFGAELRIRGSILGPLIGDALYARLRESTVVVCPSLWEAFGNVALEVKAVGVPLVATSGSGFSEFCTDGLDALLVPPGNAGALADAVERLLLDSTLVRRLTETAQESLGNFAPDEVARDFHATVLTLLSR